MKPYSSMSPGDREIARLMLIGFVLALLGTALLSLSSCTTKPTQTDARANASIQAPAVGVDSMTLPNSMTLPQNVMTLSKPSIFNRATDAIGLSTPAGRAARQQRKDARAAVPRSIGKGAVWAPLATDVVNAYKPRQTVAVARDSATLQVATNAVAGKGNTATQTATETKPGFWGALLGNPVGQIGLGVIGLFIIGAAVYGFVLWKKKKRVESIIS